MKHSVLSKLIPIHSLSEGENAIFIQIIDHPLELLAPQTVRVISQCILIVIASTSRIWECSMYRPLWSCVTENTANWLLLFKSWYLTYNSSWDTISDLMWYHELHPVLLKLTCRDSPVRDGVFWADLIQTTLIRAPLDQCSLIRAL